MNQLILGDCFEVLKKIEMASVDLIYLDPPFFSNRNYEVIWGDVGEIRSFQDRWSGGIDHYIAWLKDRVEEMHRILKPTGSIFLHCDWHANAYIRVHILDRIFGEQNFRNEIIWKRTNAKGLAFKRYAQNHDTIFYYAKSDKFTWIPQYLLHDEKYVKDFYKYVEPDTKRKYSLDNLANPNKDRPNLTYEFLGVTRVWRWTKEKMQEAYERGLIVQTKEGGVPRLKRYLDEQEGTPIDDCWLDIINVQSKIEKIGYPTQKPEALLKRIIQCASNEGDTILDPFVGGGMTVIAAEKLKRRWIGIDQSVAAIKVSELRLQGQSDLFSQPFIVQLHKYDYDTLRYKDAFAFETWIIEQFGGVANAKQINDSGIDGKTRDGKPIQVKRSDTIGRNVVDNFLSACKRYDKTRFENNQKNRESVGVIIAFSFGKGAIQEIARLKNEENTIIDLVKVEDIVPIAKKPRLSIELKDLGMDNKQAREIEFTAQGESEAGIEFYAWDWSYDQEQGVFKPEILRDKEGKQVYKFKAGTYCIAAKVVDNDGLESMEVIKLKINGGVHLTGEPA
ncbi:MAG TPA: site-specific DNA-methyltransferase [Candidatus Competibacteraceae bacterium]|nr:site-specific DNA-methyltransferase [Candidatus Competibacteraceae bacterium]HRZ07431.1 site-specific DNA-methyltransferase [Candidatus Competibacteraceae bacterium]HSA47221.1 site-specific DNA-methyltransferase [Candidatus Competibacteraceae bacterium]